MLHFAKFLFSYFFTASTLSKITILATDICARMSTISELSTRSERTLHCIQGLTALLFDVMPTPSFGIDSCLADPDDGLGASLPHWGRMATLGEVVVHLLHAHDVRLLLVTLLDRVVLAVGLDEREGHQHVAVGGLGEVHLFLVAFNLLYMFTIKWFV